MSSTGISKKVKNQYMEIEIKKVSKSDFWYSNYVGFRFTVLQDDYSIYLVRTPDGTTNIVLKSDCDVVKDES